MSDGAVDPRAWSRNPLSLMRQPVVSWISLGALGVLTLLGVALRLRQFLFNRSLWVDEAKLALNLMNRNVGELLTLPLANNQSAPPGFLLSARAAVVAFGPSEMVLRLTPLIAGVLLLLVAFALARRELNSIAAQMTFVGLIALSPALIYYASEFKQYSFDALFAITILTAVAYRETRYGTWILAGVGFVAILCSLPAVLVAAPAALLILYEALRRSQWRQVFTVGIAWAYAVALHGAYLLEAGASPSSLVQSWEARGAFAPLFPTSLAELQWYPASLYRLAYLIFGEAGRVSTDANYSWFYPLGWLLVLLLTLAVALVLVSRHWTAIVAVGAILAALLAAGLNLYPFAGRLLIFLVPVTLFIIATAIDEADRIAGPVTAGLAAMLLLSIVIPTDVEVATRPYYKSDMRGALETVEQRFADGDAIVVFDSELYRYYAHKLTSPDVFVLARAGSERTRSLIRDLREKGYRRGWFVSAHDIGRMKKSIKESARGAPIVFKWKARGTRVVLLDFAVR